MNQCLSSNSAAFIGPNPPAQRAAFQPLPGITPVPETLAVKINSSALRQLTPEQLAALDSASAGSTNTIFRAINEAVVAEERRRAEEKRKKEKKERKK